MPYTLSDSAWQTVESYFMECNLTLPAWIRDETPIDTPHKMLVVATVCEFYGVCIEDMVMEAVNLELK